VGLINNCFTIEKLFFDVYQVVCRVHLANDCFADCQTKIIQQKKKALSIFFKKNLPRCAE
jgi:hypothetical protein